MMLRLDKQGEPPRLAARLGLPVIAVAVALGLRLALVPLTGTGAPFLVFFGAVLLTTLYLGAASGILTAALSAPIAAYAFVIRAGYPVTQAAFQTLLFFLESIVVVTLAMITANAKRDAEAAADREHRAARVRDHLVAMVSHDLRSPLAAMRLGAESIGRNPADPAATARAAGRLLRSVASMDRLIQDLLDLARVEAGGLVISAKNEPAEPLFRAVLEQIRPLADAKSIDLECDLRGLESVFLRCEGPRIEQVLANLLGNAVKFTPDGGHVVIRVRPCGDCFEIEVADTGPGISAAELPYVFERFRQARASGQARAGYGLGLAIARGLVLAHGGQIWARSEPGKGTSVFFTVPRGENTAPAAVLEPSSTGPFCPAKHARQAH